MRSVIFVFATFLVVLVMPTAAVSQSQVVLREGEKARIAVKNLQNYRSECEMSAPHSIDDIITGALASGNRFEIVERKALDELTDEIDLTQDSEYFDPLERIDKGMLQGAQYLLLLKVTDYGIKEKEAGGVILGSPHGGAGAGMKTQIAVCQVDFRLVDVSTGKVLLSDSVTGEKKNRGAVIGFGPIYGNFPVIGWDTTDSPRSVWSKALMTALNEVTAKVGSWFPVQGRVMAVEGRNIYIDMGSERGLRAGVKLQVFRPMDVTNQAGDVVFEKKEPVCSATASDVRPQSAQAVLDSDAAALEGDLVLMP